MYTLEIKLTRGSIISANPLVQVKMVVSKRLYDVLIYVKIIGKN